MANLSFTLSPADAVLFKSLQQKAILPELAVPGEGELVKLFKQKKKEQQKAFLAPYADILETEILHELASRKKTILKKLTECEGTSFAVPLCSWNTIHYRESLQELGHRVSAMTPDELRAHYANRYSQEQLFEANGWESMFGTKDVYTDEDGERTVIDGYYPVKVDRIFRNTDLAQRVSLALGPNFFPFIGSEYIETPGSDWREDSFWVYKKTLYVRYYPFGVSKTHMTRLLDVLKAKNARQTEGKYVALKATEEATGSGVLFTCAADPVPLLAFSPPPIRTRSLSQCFCGCEDEDSGRVDTWA